MDNPINRMNRFEAQSLKDAIADVLCWHNGFECAKPDYKAPPGLYILERFGTDLQNCINKLD